MNNQLFTNSGLVYKRNSYLTLKNIILLAYIIEKMIGLIKMMFLRTI